MCGIGFIINYGKKRIELEFIRHLFERLEIRGSEATGYYYERETKNKGMLRGVVKAPYKASLFWKMTQQRELFEDKKQYDKFLEEVKDDAEIIKDLERNKDIYKKHKLIGNERLIMLHTRLKTQGSELNNLNNHPIFSDYKKKSGYVLIHNGVIYKGNVKKYPYYAQVDSEDILANIETYGISKGLKKIQGSMAIAFKKMIGDTLYIFRNANPYDLVYMPKEKLLIGISDERYILKSETEADKFDLTKILIEGSYRGLVLPIDKLFSINLKKPEIKYEESLDVSSYNISGNNFDRGTLGMKQEEYYSG